MLQKLYRKIGKNNLRATGKGLKGCLDVFDYIKICELFNNTCAYCGKKAPNTIDHIVALKHKVFGTEPCNVVPACERCNQKKSDMDVWEFMEWRNTPEEHQEKVQMVMNLSEYTGEYSIIDMEVE